MDGSKHVKFDGRLVIVGFGSVGQGSLPLLLRHIDMPPDRICIVTGDDRGGQTEFRRIAGGLGGGSGWTVLGYNRHLGTLENYWMADHMHGAISAEPLLVLDMYEHSYHMDYGAAAARYVDAFFANIDWERVLARIETLG